jgi:uncharacterized protein (TIGR02687 family)
MSKIQQSIEKLLQKHRILLWYDSEQAFTEEFESLELENVQKFEVKGNEFETKVTVLHKQPDTKFLLYIPCEKPADEENWLLDIELAHHVYHTDQEALYLQEVGLGYHYKEWIHSHIEFFKNKERVASFKDIAQEEDGDRTLSLKLLQVVFNTDTLSLNHFLREYTSALVHKNKEALERELNRFNLTELFWQEVERTYGYQQESPSIYDFLIEAFQKNFTPTTDKASVNKETGVLLSEWKDTLSFQEDYKAISRRIQDDLQIEEILNDVSIEEINRDDVFELIDQRVLSELIRGVLDGSTDRKRLEQIIKQRESKYWFERYQHFYHALRVGFNLLEFVKENEEIAIPSFEEGFELYTGKWYQVDQDYRVFIEQYRATNQNNVLNPLYQAVNKAYSNNWLLNIGDVWQKKVEEQQDWKSTHKAQRKFFDYQVKPYIEDKTRVFVIISDALRYECGVDVHQRILKENRFESELDYQIGSLPSYTQLGMASLLPNTTLEISGQKDEVLLDGKSTKGTSAREKILKKNSGVEATTVLAEDLMKMASRSEEARSLVTNHDVIYVYHNRIDKLGDDKSSEEKVIEAAREEVEFLMELVRKISNMGGYHMLITADHGFIYQHDELEESDFADAELEGEVIKKSRRFVIGKNLTHKDNVVKYQASDLGLEGDIEVLIPKSINRLRVQGAGSRFVHGGSTLQEVVIPVLKVKKLREDNVRKTNVDLLNKRSNKITTNIQRVNLYQIDPVGDNLLPRTLKIQFKSEGGEILSDVFNYTFDSDSKSAKDREVEHRFQISSKASEEYKNQTIYLYLEEQVEGSNKWVEYDKYPFTVNISFANDFDDF